MAHRILAKYTANPVAGCMDALKQAMRFASDCKWECLVMGTENLTVLKLYSESDWTGLHSTTGDASSRSRGLIHTRFRRVKVVFLKISQELPTKDHYTLFKIQSIHGHKSSTGQSEILFGFDMQIWSRI